MNMNFLTTAAQGGGSVIIMVVYIAVIVGAMYFFMVKPQRKEQKRLAAMINALEVGDVVITTSGFYGTVISIQDEDCIVEFGNNKNCRIPMRKSAIAEVEKASDAE